MTRPSGGSTPSMTVERADEETIDRVEALLEENDLTYRDVRTKPECFVLAHAGTEFVGVGGVEPAGSNGLLRSVAIEESRRGRGYGTALCDALEARAREDGVETLYLLTTTASAFFRRSGYEEVVREDVPPSIRRTTEFTDLCPDSATCLRKHVER